MGIRSSYATRSKHVTIYIFTRWRKVMTLASSNLHLPLPNVFPLLSNQSKSTVFLIWVELFALPGLELRLDKLQI
jgi:hypothetical protein